MTVGWFLPNAALAGEEMNTEFGVACPYVEALPCEWNSASSLVC